MPLYGDWYNELGSYMNLQGSGASVWGIYQTSVGQASGTYDLVGSCDAAPYPAPYGQAVGWTVAWNNAYGNSHSLTGWVGQYQKDSFGNEEVYTLWLLASEVTPDMDWASTNVGQDTFRRTAPTKEMIGRRKRTGGSPHPVGPPQKK